MDWIFVIVAGLLEVLSINYMNKWQLIKKFGLKKSSVLIVKMCLAFGGSLVLLNFGIRYFADEHYICRMVRYRFCGRRGCEYYQIRRKC